MITKGKLLLAKGLVKTFGAAHFVAQSSADLILKAEVESVSRLYDCKDARVDIALSRKHTTKQTQKKVVATVKKYNKSLTELTKGTATKISNLKTA